jgi:hypothetical protein
MLRMPSFSSVNLKSTTAHYITQFFNLPLLLTSIYAYLHYVISIFFKYKYKLRTIFKWNLLKVYFTLSCVEQISLKKSSQGVHHLHEMKSLSINTALIIGLCILLRMYQLIYIETSVRNKCQCSFYCALLTLHVSAPIGGHLQVVL